MHGEARIGGIGTGLGGAGGVIAQGNPEVARPRLTALADRLEEHCKLLHAMGQEAQEQLDRIQGPQPPQAAPDRGNEVSREPASTLERLELLMRYALLGRERLHTQLHRLNGL